MSETTLFFSHAWSTFLAFPNCLFTCLGLSISDENLRLLKIATACRLFRLSPPSAFKNIDNRPRYSFFQCPLCMQQPRFWGLPTICDSRNTSLDESWYLPRRYSTCLAPHGIKRRPGVRNEASSWSRLMMLAIALRDRNCYAHATPRCSATKLVRSCRSSGCCTATWAEVPMDAPLIIREKWSTCIRPSHRRALAFAQLFELVFPKLRPSSQGLALASKAQRKIAVAIKRGIGCLLPVQLSAPVVAPRRAAVSSGFRVGERVPWLGDAIANERARCKMSGRALASQPIQWPPRRARLTRRKCLHAHAPTSGRPLPF